jgi:hypothetical protein
MNSMSSTRNQIKMKIGIGSAYQCRSLAGDCGGGAARCVGDSTRLRVPSACDGQPTYGASRHHHPGHESTTGSGKHADRPIE